MDYGIDIGWSWMINKVKVYLIYLKHVKWAVAAQSVGEPEGSGLHVCISGLCVCVCVCKKTTE